MVVVPVSMRNARPSMARQFLAMLPGHGWIALQWAARLGAHETHAAHAKRDGGGRGPLGGLRVSEPGVCCDTGHHMGVDVVNAARLAPCTTGCAGCVTKYPAASGTWSVERRGGAIVNGERTPKYGALVPGRAGPDTGLLCMGVNAARLAVRLGASCVWLTTP